MAKFKIRQTSFNTPIQVYGYKLTEKDKQELSEDLAAKLLENNTTAKYIEADQSDIDALKAKIAAAKAEKERLAAAAKPPTVTTTEGAGVQEEPTKTKK